MRNLLQLTVLLVFMMHQVVFAQNDCGNTSFSGRKGVVTSPDFPLPYPHDLNCTYSINVGRNNSVLLRFIDLDLEPPLSNGRCTSDWLTITCGGANPVSDDDSDDDDYGFPDDLLDYLLHQPRPNVERQNSRHRFCGADIPRTPLRFTDCPVVTLMFYADSSVSGGGFSVEYTVNGDGDVADDISDLECGQTVFTHSPGVIRLPRNPTDYAARVNCTYIISTNYTSRFEFSTASFTSSQLVDSFGNCSRDHILLGCVTDVETDLNRNTSYTFCRSTLSLMFIRAIPIVFPNCRIAKISIRSSNYNYRGYGSIPFTFRTKDAECGTISFTRPTGLIASPHFPLSYPHSLDCVYTIDVDRTKTVVLDFLTFDLEVPSHSMADGMCRYDWLSVNCVSDGRVVTNPSQNRKYCGIIGKAMRLNFSNCDSLTLNFVSDTSVTGGGFQIRYTRTESGSAGSNTTNIPDEGCGNTSFAGDSGFISSPRFPLSYPNNLDCVYSIAVDRAKLVVLRFLSFDIEGVSHYTHYAHQDTCSYDWLLISCISNNTRFYHQNRKYCGSKATPFILGFPNCDSMTVRFFTDSSVTGRGFQLRYTVTPADNRECGETSFSGQSGILTSPNYPFPYPYNMSCTYSIDVDRNSSVLLKFKNFELGSPDSMNICKDWLRISCNETTKANPQNYKKYCGVIEWTSPLRFDDCPSLLLEFVSDSVISHSGFLIEYTMVENSNLTDDDSDLDCGATFFANSSGLITFPNNPKKSLATINCTYTIAANRLSYITLDPYPSTTIQFLKSFQDCATDRLTIRCVPEGGTDPNPNTTVTFCYRERSAFHHYPPRSLVFADCRTLKFSISSAHYDNKVTFRIPFSVLGSDDVCGNTSFSSPSGVVASRPLRQIASLGIKCLYTIDTGHVNSFVLNFDRLNIGNVVSRGAACNNSWLTITCLVNGTARAQPLASRKLCSLSYLSTATLSFPSCRSILLNYSTNYDSYDTGFHMRYRTGDYDPECGNSSFSGPTGILTSPRFPLAYAHNLNCLYSIINGEERKTILLSFITFSLEGTSIPSANDTCSHDWVTVNCVSDRYAVANDSSSRKYCGLKSTPLKLAFSNCIAVVLNFRSDSTVTGGGFKMLYSVIETDSICGAPVYGRPSGAISFPWNSTDFGHNFDCKYVINATKPSSISLTIWSTSLQGLAGGNCQRDWLMITCTNGQTGLDHKVSHRSCAGLTSSTQLTLPVCAVVQIVYHREAESTGKTFRIEYTIRSQGESALTTGSPTTSISPTSPVTAKTSCATGCKLSPDATFCECLPDASKTPAITTTTEIPVTRTAKCEAGCQKSTDGTTCDCSTAQSGGDVVNPPLNLTGQRNHAVGISLTVILLVIGAICLAAFVLFRQHQKKNRSEMLLPAIEDETTQLEGDTTKSGSLLRYHRDQDQDTSSYVQLERLSFNDHENRSFNRNISAENEN